MPTDRAQVAPPLALPPHMLSPTWYGEQDEYGIDLSLIRENLRLTPIERVRRAQAARLDVLRTPDGADDGQRSSLERIAAVLLGHGVEFLLIGGLAELLYGAPRATADIDVAYRRTPDNIQRLAAALGGLAPTLRGTPPESSPRLDAATLSRGVNFMLSTPLGYLDLIGHAEPIGGYEALMPRAASMRVGTVNLAVIGLDDLITIKRYLGRPKDRDSLAHLLAIKRLRDETAHGGPAA